MKILPAITVATTLLASCRTPQQPELTAAGFVGKASSASCIVIDDMESDPPRRLSFAIDDDTRFEGGDMIEGNIAEVTYRPAAEGQPAVAVSVTADTTYPEVIGRWKTPENAKLPVTIELLVHGGVRHILPSEAMTFTRWQLEGSDDTITLFGTIKLPDEETPREFATEAVLSKEEGRKILTLKPQGGKPAKLHFVE